MNIKINQKYYSNTSVYKIVKSTNCKIADCYHIKLRWKGILFMWGELPIHYTLEESKIVIPNLVELDKTDKKRYWYSFRIK